MKLRKNQELALKTSIENDFESGIHYHATGTGKSIISFEILLAYNLKYPKHNVIWLCEQKSILNQQFCKDEMKQKGYENIFKIFNVLSFVNNKDSYWYQAINSNIIWGKPLLIIINRAFCVSSLKYTKIKIPIHLILHDECHTITNNTTQQFYKYVLEKWDNIKCIGFTATPTDKYPPFNKLLTNYSIYDGVKDKVILPPKIVWFKSEDIIQQLDILKMYDKLKEMLYYKKVIVWCGMIELCYEMAELWNDYFTKSQQKISICIDTSCVENDSQNDKQNNIQKNKFITYQEFEQLERDGILFCAAKHREGSDIKNLDCAIFLDKVENRNHKTFVQCLGRVLRIDNDVNKKFGLIIDVKAKNSIKICDRMNEYLQFKGDIFPWHYEYSYEIINNKKIQINTLDLVISKEESIQKQKLKSNKYTLKAIQSEEDIFNISDELYSLNIIKLYSKFKRPIPNDDFYIDRLYKEYNLFKKKKLLNYLFRALKILELAGDIPHVTRGSCGSSLICYLLGISHVDPIKYNIKFARFLNEYRNTLPDIDFDFPHNMRDDIFLKLELNWPGKVARISNHIHYHEKSAIREAFRKMGINKFIGKYEIHNEMNKLSLKERRKLKEISKKLENEFRGYSLHCGGIVFFPEGIPEKLILEQRKHNLLSQITLDKNDVSDSKQFKIDILSSRGLSQLHKTLNYKNIDFENFENCPLTIKMLGDGDNIGLTLAESSLIKKEMIKIQPKTIKDLAIILAIIRPAAKEARENISNLDNKIIFDDDAIEIIEKTLNCDEGLADKFRKGFTKGSKEIINEMKRLYDKNSKGEKSDKKFRNFLNSLENIKKYSFCKAHAFSYAQLIWKLAYVKVHHPRQFWHSTLLYCQSSYRKWVHLYEALLAGVDFRNISFKKHDVSIYASHKKKKFTTLSIEEQLRKFGYWDFHNKEFFPGCYCHNLENSNKSNNKDNDNYKAKYKFKGIIASSRILSYSYKNPVTVYYIGVAPKKYIEVISMIKPNKKQHNYNRDSIGIEGVGIFCNKNGLKQYSNKFLVLESNDLMYF